MTIQKKTALLFTGIMAAILLAVCFLTYFFTNTFVFRDFYKRLEIRAIVTANAKFGNYAPSVVEAYDEIRQQHLERLPGEKEFFFRGDSVAAFANSPEGRKLPKTFYADLLANRKPTYKRGNFFYTGVAYNNDSKKYIVIIGAENSEYTYYAKNLGWILVICFLSGIVIAYTSGIFFSSHTFKPVRDIIEKVKTIKVENLHLRLAEANGEDEVALLAQTFNNMLSRLETAFEAQNNFISNASHELRTPLTAIYGEAEIALSRPRTEEGYKATLQIILQQAEKLQHLTDSLLTLAQTGFDGKTLHLRIIRIDDLLTDVKRTINNLLPENKVTIDHSELRIADQNVSVKGNYELLKLGISNVVINACKYSNNQDVSVTVTTTPDKVHITTRDKGIGIPADELRFIYDPFFRASNTGNYKGYGIGLPLTRNIFRIHKGEILVTSESNKGTTVKLTLPTIKQ